MKHIWLVGGVKHEDVDRAIAAWNASSRLLNDQPAIIASLDPNVHVDYVEVGWDRCIDDELRALWEWRLAGPAVG